MDAIDEVFVLPFFLLKDLHITRTQLWGLISLFGLGGLAIIMSIARVVALAISATTSQVAIWTALECSVGILVACCPALRILFRRLRGGSQTSTTQTRSATLSNNRHSRWSLPVKVLLPTKLLPSHHRDGDVEMNEMDERILPPHQIFKNVDFEIDSERASQNSRQKMKDNNARVEAWEIQQQSYI
jgi:hypothetical protein